MESKKINQLATELTPALSDLTIIGDPTTGISKKITLSQMANLFTGTVEEYANLAAFPLVGTGDTIYIALDTNILYRWDTTLTSYVELSPNIVTSLVFSDANGFDGTISLVGSTATLTITTALTTGSVPFIGASGALSQDNANLFFDDTNNRLGINTNAPTTALDVFGSGIIGRINGTSTNNAYLGFSNAGSNKWSIGNVQSDHRFRIYNEATTSELVSVLQTGEFGIGIANPLTKLHIFGGASALIANLDANTSVAKSISFRSGNSSRINLEVSGTESGSNAGMDFYIRRYSDAGALIDTPFYIKRSTGNIGVGTTSPNVSGQGSDVRVLTVQGQGGNWGGFESGATTFENGALIGFYGFTSTTVTGNSAAGMPAYIGTWLSGTTGSTIGSEMRFFTKGNNASVSQRMVINNSGNIGIGTATPTEKLHIVGTGLNTQTLILESTSSTANAYIGFKNSSKSYTIGLTVDAGINNFLIYDNTSAATRFLISSAGNVGIGTSSPSVLLQVEGNSAGDNIGLRVKNNNIANGNKYAALFVGGTSAGVTEWNNSGVLESAAGTNSNLVLSNYEAGNIIFQVNNRAERMRITSGGQVFINQTTASAAGAGTKMQVATDILATGNAAGFFWENRSGGVTNNSNWYGWYTTSGTIYLYNGAGNIASINASSGAYTALSDINKKKDFEDSTIGLNAILNLKPTLYRFKDEDESVEKHLGFIAQEVKPYIPQAFVETEGEDENFIGLDDRPILAALVKGMQEQQQQIEELKALINK